MYTSCPSEKGKQYLSSKGVASAVLGGWRVAGIQQYVSGTPISVGTTVSFPIFNGANRATVPTYDGWRAPIKGGKFDPNVDSFLQPVSFFGPQPTTGFGNETRYNPEAALLAGLQRELLAGPEHHLTGSRSAWTSDGRRSTS